MERTLHTVILPDGLPLDICQEVHEEHFASGTQLIPGLKFFRVAGNKITYQNARDLLVRSGHADVVERFNIPSH